MNIFEDLVTYDQIRYAAGVSEVEIGDEELENSGLDQELQLDVAGWLPSGTTPDTLYSAAWNVAATLDDQQKLWAMAAYAKYFCALQLHVVGLVRFAKSITDSENEMQRDVRDTDELLNGLRDQANRHKTKLLELLDEEVSTASKFNLMGVSSPDYDPVTG